jgi:hypothetical protein
VRPDPPFGRPTVGADATWHTCGTQTHSYEQIWLNHALCGGGPLLVMMGSGVRVPASASPVGKSLQTGILLIRRFSRHRITANDGVAGSSRTRASRLACDSCICRIFLNGRWRHARDWRLARPGELAKWHTRGTRDGTSWSLVARRHAPLPITSDHGVTGGEKLPCLGVRVANADKHFD